MDVDSSDGEHGTESNEPSLYDVLGVSREASPKEIKKAYYKLAMQHHPDRNQGDADSASKFQEILKAYTILFDDEKRKMYDATGCTDDDAFPGNRSYDEWYDYWRNMFSKITVKDIDAFEKKYVGSEMETEDLQAAYLEAEGDFDGILDRVPCCSADDEDRFRTVLTPLIEAELLPVFEAFARPNDKKKKKRLKRAAREAREAEELAAELGITPGQSLQSAIMQRQKQQGNGKEKLSKHEEQMTGIADALMAKYGDAEASGKKKAKKGKKVKERAPPTDEEFEALQAKMFKN